jgi:hypothetical protein
MLRQRRLIGPLLYKDETIGILGIYMHCVRNTAGLGPRTSDVRLAQAESFLNSAALRDNTSDYENHSNASVLATVKSMRAWIHVRRGGTTSFHAGFDFQPGSNGG